jgi:hypothetical protein
MTKQTAADMTHIYTRIVERYASFFARPEARLRFLNSTVARQVERQEKLRRSLSRFAFIQKTPFYRWFLEGLLYHHIIEELTAHIPHSKAERERLWQTAQVPLSARLFLVAYRWRYAFYGLGAVTAAAALVGLYFVGAWSAGRVNDYLARRYQASGRTVGGQITVLAADALVKILPGYRPEKVWLVKQEGNSEQYSNGGRILTEHTTESRPRNYYLYPKGNPFEPERGEIQRAPIGIVYHTSESELLKFVADNNDDLLVRSRGLLAWVKKHKLYNYVIDRFGQVYRVVPDEQAANHAGHSLWSDQKHIYVGLNESFIGVSFETKSEAGEDQLTEAQITSGRQLTAILRSRHNIDDANCVTHGLVSINPDQMVIGAHYDWIRGFPFEAMGLSDKYKVPPSAIRDYGCFYEDELLGFMGGKPQPGMAEAEAEFRRRAEAAQLTPEELRRRTRDRYREQIELVRKLREAGAGNDEQANADPSHPQSESKEKSR